MAPHLILVPVEDEETPEADDAVAVLETTEGRGLEDQGAIQE